MIYGTDLFSYAIEHPAAFDPWEGEDRDINRQNDQGEPSPVKVDSDQDGLWDGFDRYNGEIETLMYFGELYYYDYENGMGMPYSAGWTAGYKPAQRSAHPGTYIQQTNQVKADTDGDGLTDIDECVIWSLPLERLVAYR